MFLKRCSECKHWKTKKEFSKNRCRKDGLQDYCKQCQKISHQEYCRTHKKELAEYSRQYQKMHKKERAEYRLKHIDRYRKHNAKRGGLGYNPLNEYFKGSEMHHIDNENVVFIPRKIHRKFMGGSEHSLKQHRKSILNYYGSLKRMINNNPIGGIE